MASKDGMCDDATREAGLERLKEESNTRFEKLVLEKLVPKR